MFWQKRFHAAMSRAAEQAAAAARSGGGAVELRKSDLVSVGVTWVESVAAVARRIESSGILIGGVEVHPRSGVARIHVQGSRQRVEIVPAED